MFGLAPFAGAPFSSILTLTTGSDLTGLQANALLNSVTAGQVVTVALTGQEAIVYLMAAGSSSITPSYWTLIDTSQYNP